MTNHAVVAIVIRLAGIVMGVQGLTFIVLLAETVFQSSEPLPRLTVALAAMWVVISATLIAAPNIVARIALPTPTRSDGGLGWSVDEFQVAAFSVVGINLVTTALTDRWNWDTIRILIEGVKPTVSTASSHIVIHFGAFLTRLGIGLWLLFGAVGLRGLLRRARTAGLK